MLGNAWNSVITLRDLWSALLGNGIFLQTQTQKCNSSLLNMEYVIYFICTFLLLLLATYLLIAMNPDLGSEHVAGKLS